LHEIFEIAFEGNGISKADFLGKIADSSIGENGSRGGFQLFSEDFGKGGFSDTIRSNDTEQMSGRKGKIEIFENGMKGVVGFFEIIDRKLNLRELHWGKDGRE
jgi:hypothetical protein